MKTREGWREVRISDFCEINPNERLSKGTLAKKVAMEILQPFTKKISRYSLEKYEGGVKFRNGDTIMEKLHSLIFLMMMKLVLVLPNLLC